MSFLDYERVLVFSAHAADFCSRAGGTIARFTAAGAAVHVHDFTYGERCEAPALYALDQPPGLDEIKQIRKKEIEAAAGVLGATIDCMDFGDSPLLIGPERRLQVLDAIRAFRPDLLLCHWVDDILHPDHVEAAQAVLWARAYCDVPSIKTEHPPWTPPPFVCYEAQLGTSPVTKFLPQFYVSIDATMDLKVEAMNCLAAQPSLTEQYSVLARYRALEAQITAGMRECTFAEGFCRIGTEAIR
jgi:4-oxalomesaconate hydratase